MFKLCRVKISIHGWLIASALAGYCTTTAIAETTNHAVEKRAELTINGTGFTNFSDGVPCLRLRILIQPSQFGGQMPTRIVLATVLDETLHANWKLFNASWAVASNPHALEPGSVQLFEEPPPVGTPVDAVFDGLKQSGETYTLYLDLRPIEREESIGSDYSSASDDNARVQVAEQLRQKYKHAYQAAADDINHRGGVRVWVKEAKQL
jgi:hypothetical protein